MEGIERGRRRGGDRRIERNVCQEVFACVFVTVCVCVVCVCVTLYVCVTLCVYVCVCAKFSFEGGLYVCL